MDMKQIREMTEAELAGKLVELKRERLNLAIQARTGQLEKTARVREVRREIARINTELASRATKQVEK